MPDSLPLFCHASTFAHSSCLHTFDTIPTYVPRIPFRYLHPPRPRPERDFVHVVFSLVYPSSPLFLYLLSLSTPIVFYRSLLSPPPPLVPPRYSSLTNSPPCPSLFTTDIHTHADTARTHMWLSYHKNDIARERLRTERLAHRGMGISNGTSSAPIPSPCPCFLVWSWKVGIFQPGEMRAVAEIVALVSPRGMAALGGEDANPFSMGSRGAR
ncbi:hypothetical protein B0H14DRAFT_3500904 [Mycena olivaceomarginata]|nr:hypothetical protein B0H14DRAFT_3500904 [Mycena olivaceomarginata]